MWVFSSLIQFSVLVSVSVLHACFKAPRTPSCQKLFDQYSKFLIINFLLFGHVVHLGSKGLRLPRWGIFGLPLTHRVKILQKIKSGTSRITPHTSHITYYIGICKFYKILVINTVVNFNNS